MTRQTEVVGYGESWGPTLNGSQILSKTIRHLPLSFPQHVWTNTAHDRVDYVGSTGSAWELLINKPCCFGPMLLSVRVTDTGAGVKYTYACSRWFSPSQFIRIILLLYLYINNFLPSLSPSLLIFHLIPKFSLSLSLISSLLYPLIRNVQSEEGGGKRERRKTRRVLQMTKKKKITKNYWREGGRTKSTKRKRRWTTKWHLKANQCLHHDKINVRYKENLKQRQTCPFLDLHLTPCLNTHNNYPLIARHMASTLSLSAGD